MSPVWFHCIIDACSRIVYCACNVVGQWKQSCETAGTSTSVSHTSVVDSVSDLAPVAAVSDVDLRSVASPTDFIEKNFAVS